MKRFLLSLSLLTTAYFGHSQILLNEVYTNPGNNNSEFFELYNAGINTGVSLDCYTIVSYFNNGTSKGFYVIDLPNISIASKSYIVGAADSLFSVQKKNGVKPDFNWNGANLIDFGGSFTKYTYNQATSNYTITATTLAERKDFFARGSLSSDPDYAVFLFNAGSAAGGNATYVNGFLGKYTSSTVPASITGLPPLTGLSNTCGTYSLNWPDVKNAEFVGKADGSDNGYIRYGDGLCGAWDKANSAHTPGVTNGPGSISTTSGGITTTENLVCGNTKAIFQITGTTDAGSFPVEVQLFYDNGTIGTLDALDVYQKSITVLSASPASYTFDFSDAPAGQKVLLVYKTALGCYNKIVAPVAATAVTTIQKNICGTRVDFSIVAVTGSLSTYSFPVTVQMHYDPNNNGLVDLGEEAVVNSTTAATAGVTYSLNIPDAGQNIVLVYSSLETCLNQVAKANLITGVLNTTQINVCGNKVDFKLTGASTADATQYALPVTVNMYYDLNQNGIVDPDETIQGTTIINSFSATTYSLPITGSISKVILSYEATAACLSKTVVASNSTGALMTTQKSYCGKRVDFQVTGATLDAATYAFPVIAELHYDANGNGALDAGDETVQVSRTIPAASNTVYTFVVADPTQNLLMVYKTAQSCFGTQAIPTPTTDAETITLGGNFIDQKTANYFVVNASTNAAAFPLQLQVYEDVNKNGAVDNGELIVDTQNLSAAPPANTTYTSTMTTAGSYAIVKANSTTGCSSASYVIGNSNIPLPVTFKSFNVNRKNISTVGVSWTTASEKDNRGFNVQRNDGSGWKNVAFVFSQTVAGTSSGDLSYEYNDANTEKGVSQYRIQQVDLDGRASFSIIRAVRGENLATKLLVYPNPSSTGNVNVVFDNSIGVRDVSVSDATGRLVRTFKSVTNNVLLIENLRKGFYTLRVTNRTTAASTVEKVIVNAP